MVLRIDINMDNAAFCGDPATEASNVLRQAALWMRKHAGWSPDTLMGMKTDLIDFDGKVVGQAKYCSE
jgi:hypothetical protein